MKNKQEVKNILIDGIEYVPADQLVVAEKDIKSLEDLIGTKVFLRTVTYHIIGKVVGVFGDTLRLENASWVTVKKDETTIGYRVIKDGERYDGFMQAIKDGKLDEVEPVGDWNVNYATVVDWGFWLHNLPTEQK